MKTGILHITAALLLFVFLAGSVPDSAGAMSWPSGDSVLVRNFGANYGNKPVLGMIFEGGTNILAAESGEVIFARNKNDSASRLPSPLGAWTAIDHRDGLISIYSRYNESEPDLNSVILAQVEKNQIIADCGISGWSAQSGFYFTLFDRRERRWINPAMIITPMQETRPPQIVSVSLLNAQGQAVQSSSLSQGRYTVVVNTAGGTPLSVPAANFSGLYAPHRILCSVNGAEVGSLSFESVSARDGIQMVSRNGLIPARQIYANHQSYEAAEVFLTRGQITLEVIVQDITGNSRTTVSRLTVN